MKIKYLPEKKAVEMPAAAAPKAIVPEKPQFVAKKSLMKHPVIQPANRK